jgi:hypothetical protein
MAYRLTVSDRAVREIGEAYEWYEEQLHGLGAEFIDALDAQFQLITQTPLISKSRYKKLTKPDRHHPRRLAWTWELMFLLVAAVAAGYLITHKVQL